MKQTPEFLEHQKKYPNCRACGVTGVAASMIAHAGQKAEITAAAPTEYEKMLAEAFETALIDKFGTYQPDPQEIALFTVHWIVTEGNAAKVATKARAKFWAGLPEHISTEARS